jgi:hypothetical protein
LFLKGGSKYLGRSNFFFVLIQPRGQVAGFLGILRSLQWEKTPLIPLDPKNKAGIVDLRHSDVDMDTVFKGMPADPCV